MRPNAPANRRAALGAVTGAFLATCRSRGNTAPTIEFTRIPQAYPGGKEKNDVIDGIVKGGPRGAAMVEVEINYGESDLRLAVRDTGRGIDEEVLRSGREGHWGLIGMRECAEKMGAQLKVGSSAGAGTEVAQMENGVGDIHHDNSKVVSKNHRSVCGPAGL
jgi:hypothetical protein